MASSSKPSRRARTGRNAVTLKVDMSSVNALIAELKGDVLKATRPAAQAATEVLYRAVLSNVDAIGKKTGNLRASIYQVFSQQNSKAVGDGYSRATYHVSWNAKKAPHGHLIEYGHIQKFKVYLGEDGRWYTNKKAPLPAPKQIAARPFIRPAFNRQDEAVAAAQDVIYRMLGAR